MWICRISDHNYSSKQLSNHFNNHIIPAWDPTGQTESQKKAQMEVELRGLIDVILAQDETAKYICRKLYRFCLS